MFKQKTIYMIVLGVIAVSIQLTALACEYNVRDVGFVDLKTMPYTLYIYVDNTTPETVSDNLEEALFMGLLDSNIDSVIVNVDTDTEHHALRLLQEHEPAQFPTAMLVSPKGFHQPIEIAEASRSGIEAIEARLESLITSPFRTSLLNQVTDTYGVVLIVEGPDADENTEIKDAATRSARKIHTRMKMLPKAIANPPVVMTITSDDYKAESMLLWSLAIDPSAITGAHAVVIYGRGRQMGPVLTGEAITEKRLTGYLSVIGADCECGLDRSWMQGTMIPLQWSDEIQSIVSSTLGFDPENPRTKMEISMTISKGQRNRLNGGSDTKNPDSIQKLSFAYNEDVVAFADEESSILDDDSEEIVELEPSLFDGDTSRSTADEGLMGTMVSTESVEIFGFTVPDVTVSKPAAFLGTVASLVIIVTSFAIIARVRRRG